jgi:class 3 adenylate cyclase
MSASTTVVFADLTGSTAVFEALGNSLATEAVTTLTQWIGSVCQANGGRVVKVLGDGVLALFTDAPAAIAAVVQMQREHSARLQEWPNHLRMKLQVGVASGEVVDVDGDCYGDAVNTAARLSDLSGPEQIWASQQVVSQLRSPPPDVRFRNLGPLNIRGKAGTQIVYRVDWHEDVNTISLTQPAPLEELTQADASSASIELSWLDQQVRFLWLDLPMHLGRDSEAQFIVADQRVSRLHARISARGTSFVLSDVSSFGTWLRFEGSTREILLRREECILHTNGEIGLGAPFDDFTAPVVAFRLSGF